MTATFVDSNVLLDVATADPEWGAWSAARLAYWADRGTLFINAVVYAEVSVDYASASDVEVFLASGDVKVENLPLEAAFEAGKCYRRYRRQGGSRTSPLPDFFIGAHALVQGYRLLTRDARRYRTYFPKLELVCPPDA